MAARARSQPRPDMTDILYPCLSKGDIFCINFYETWRIDTIIDYVDHIYQEYIDKGKSSQVSFEQVIRFQRRKRTLFCQAMLLSHFIQACLIRWPGTESVAGPRIQGRRRRQKEASLSEALWKLKHSCFQAKGK